MHVTAEEIRRRFRERGLKLTPQRAAIYRALVESRAHPTAEDLLREVQREHPMVSPNTVYYTLGALRRAGLVQEVNYWHDRARFDGNLAPHHHLICLGCRTITDLTDAALDRLAAPAGSRAGFVVTGHRVEFHGYCAGCRRRGRGRAGTATGRSPSSQGRRTWPRV